jgi:hypothetical protein
MADGIRQVRLVQSVKVESIKAVPAQLLDLLGNDGG